MKNSVKVSMKISRILDTTVTSDKKKFGKMMYQKVETGILKISIFPGSHGLYSSVAEKPCDTPHYSDMT